MMYRKCMPLVPQSINFSKPVTDYSLMSRMKEPVMFMWGASFSSWIKERGIFMCSASKR